MYHPTYRPEGDCIPADNVCSLINAIGSGEIFQAPAVKCTESHDLIVQLPGARGVIPREDAAWGVRQGRVKDIAIISRVGKPVSFTVKDRTDAGDFLLSRAAAQRATLDWYMANRWPGDIVAGRITHMEGFGVFVDIGCGVISFIGVENISVSRIPHPCHRFAVGQDILAVILDKDPELDRITLTHRELLGTWEQNATLLCQGDTVEGVVRGVEDYGMFVEIFPNLSGLAERREGIGPGDRVSVYVKSINPERMKIKLAIVDRLPPRPPVHITRRDYRITLGPIGRWRYSPARCESKLIQRIFAP